MEDLLFKNVSIPNTYSVNNYMHHDHTAFDSVKYSQDDFKQLEGCV